MKGVLAGEFEVKDFCLLFERHYNFEWPDRSSCNDIRIFEDLFNEVVLFSPLPKEKWEYPKYRTADEVLVHVRQSLSQLRA